MQFLKRNGGHLRRIVIGVAIAYFLLVGSGCHLADFFILFPPKGAIDAGPAARKVIRVKDHDLEIWTAKSPKAQAGEPEGFVLEFCGNSTRAEQIAQFAADRWKSHAVEAWVVNYPGYGGSAGPARLASIPPAALAAYDELAKVAAGRPIFVEANSLGTTPALYVAAQRPAAGLVLQNPPPLRELILQRHGWWNLWLLAGPVAWQIPPELSSVHNAPRVTAPAVFLLADQDELVKPKYQKMVVDAFAGPKRLITMSHASHNDSVNGPAAAELANAIEWLWDNAGKSH